MGKVQPGTRDHYLAAPEIGPDTVIPRNPDCDTFTRPVDLKSKTLEYGRRPLIIHKEFNNQYIGDEEVLSMFKSAPDLSRMINSVVIVDVGISTANGKLRRCTGTGCLVSPSVIFTVGHHFEREDGDIVGWITVYLTAEDYLEGIRGFNCDQEVIPSEILELMDDTLNVTSDEGPVEWSSLDFAVLRLKYPFDRPQESLLQMPVQYPGLSELYGRDQTICYMGMPGVLGGNITDAFSSRFQDYLKSKYEHPRNILKEFVQESFFGGETVVASFGTTLCSYGKDIGQYYVTCIASTLNGMSGGPVVNMAAPDTLLGIVLNGYKTTPYSLFLRADCAIVQACYRHFVLGKDI